MNNKPNYASDLHRKGELYKVEQMEIFARSFTKGVDVGRAFITECYYGADAYCLLPNHPGLVNRYSGYVVFNEDTNRPEFVKGDDE